MLFSLLFGFALYFSLILLFGWMSGDEGGFNTFEIGLYVGPFISGFFAFLIAIALALNLNRLGRASLRALGLAIAFATILRAGWYVSVDFLIINYVEYNPWVNNHPFLATALSFVGLWGVTFGLCFISLRIATRRA